MNGWKSGSRIQLGNYRPIALMSVVAKLYERIIADRLTKYLEEEQKIVEEQGGFRVNRGCVDQIFILNEVIESRRERGKKTYIAFMDFTKAYDLVWRDGLFQELHEAGVKGKAWRVVRDMYRKARSCVTVKGKPSDWWNIHQGVRQGSVLSPLLFSIAINPLIHELKKRRIGVRLGPIRGISEPIHIPGLLFADDLVVMTETEQELRDTLKFLDQWAKRRRFIFNPKKCGVLVTKDNIEPSKRDGGKWMLGNEEIPEVNT